MKKLLFVCSRNRLRSPTAEQVFASYPDIKTASAGISHDAEEPLSAELIVWADMLFVMEKGHLAKLRSRFRAHLRGGLRVICLDIPDDYDYMQPELVELLRRKVGAYL